jgi:hypothetical protein
MSLFGKGKKDEPKKVTKTVAEKSATKPKTSTKGDSQAEEARKLLEKMEAKKAAGDCPFC